MKPSPSCTKRSKWILAFISLTGCLGTALQLKGQLSEADCRICKAVELNDDPSVLALLGQAYARAGQREEAQKILVRLSEEAKSRYVQAYSFALMYLGLGRQRARD